MSALDTWRQFLRKWEGGISNHPADTGGYTNAGVTIGTWNAYARRYGWTSGTSGLSRMSTAQWNTITADYWRQVGADRVRNPAVAFLLADMGWGSGPGTAVRLLQRALGEVGQSVAIDGAFGRQTEAAVARANPTALFNALNRQRRTFLQNIVANNPSQAVFLQGWMNRVNDLGKWVAENKWMAGGIGTGVLVAAGLAMYLIFRNKQRNGRKAA